jgi:hypothetical protein
MTALTGGVFTLTEGTLIVVSVQSHNTIGYSAASPENTSGALVQRPPHAPPTAPTRGSASSESQLEVNFAAYSADGGSAILAYGLEIDRGDGSGYTPVIDSNVNTATITSNINSGQAYQVRYRARNVHGWSTTYSTPLTIYAAVIPVFPASDIVSTSNLATSKMKV